MRYAISSHQATVFGLTCFAYLLVRSGFERVKARIPLLGRIEKQFNSLSLRLAKSMLNLKLVGPRLFDAVELHLTDPRTFYNPLEWKINETMIKLVKGPISSFHAHVETNPFLRKYVFNLADTSVKTKKAIRSQLEAAYKIMRAHPDMVVAENPVFVFHAGVARNEDDRERALARTREGIEYIAIANRQLHEGYGRHRKIIPTIENSAADSLSLCQTVDEWKQAIRGFEDEIKLTLDYGHIQTVRGEKKRLLKELEQGTLGNNIVNLHLHYSPEVEDVTSHAHAPLSKIPQEKLHSFEDDLRQILTHTRIRNHGYVTLEVPSMDPRDYIPRLECLNKGFSIANRVLRSLGLFDWSSYRGTIEDQLASLELARQVITV